MSSKLRLLSAASLAAMTMGSVSIEAWAQQYEDEIIITATRRAESIQDVPIAVTAVMPEQLEKQGIVNIQNLTSVAPSFSTSNAQTSSGTVVLRIRGVGTTSNNIGFESAVGVFIDGAYQSRPGVALGEFVDVERVEVLRGPQGTLFGRNTSAGALNVTNVRPDLNSSGGFVNATAGSYEHMSLQGAINVPIVEGKVAARLTGAIREREGFVKVYDGNGQKLGNSNAIDQHMLRGQIGWEADSGFKGRVIADYSKSTAECCSAIELLQASVETDLSFRNVGLGHRGGMAGPVVAISPTDTASMEQAMDNLIASSNQVPNPSMDQIGITAELEYPISDNADVIYIGSYREYDSSELYDSAFSGLDVFNVASNPAQGGGTFIDTMTHELRVQGNAGKLDWLVGAYYSEEDINQKVNFELGADYGELIGALFYTPTGGGFGPDPLRTITGVDADVVSATNNYIQNSKSFSVFTHNIFDVTDDLSLTVGLRYSDESKDGSFDQPAVNNPLCNTLLANLDLPTLQTGGGLVFNWTHPVFGIPLQTPAALGSNLFGTGCFAFTAPADHPYASFLPLPRTFNSEFKDDELIYTGKASYDFGDASAYASFTHGYKSGGFNLDSTAAIGGADPQFASEEVDAYEIGLKSKLADGRVTLNVAAFREEFTNFQVLEFTGAQFVTFNVPKAETQGVEVEMSAKATDNLSLNGAVTLLDANYPDDCAGTQTAINVTALCGNTLTNAPKTVGIAGANYTGDLTGDLQFFLNGQIRYESDRRTSTQAVILASGAPNPFDIQEANTKLNLRAGIGNEDADWSLEAWATNLTNQVTRGVTFNTVLRGTSRSAFVQEPRMYGVTVRKGF